MARFKENDLPKSKITASSINKATSLNMRETTVEILCWSSFITYLGYRFSVS
jgi:hypothetical protein